MIPSITPIKLEDSNVIDLILILPNLKFEYRINIVPYAKLRKATDSPYLSAWNNSAPTGRIFMKFDIWVFFRKYV
jgi:hypothetical protein